MRIIININDDQIDKLELIRTFFNEKTMTKTFVRMTDFLYRKLF